MTAVTLTGGLALWFLKRKKDRDALELRHFSQEEFGAYWPMMSQALLVKIDEFRHRLGYPVAISPAPGAIGRPIIGQPDPKAESGAESSYHNYLIHGEILALDLMPKPPGGATPTERQRWVTIARELGFTGIGLYPDWRPRPGIHLDIRPASKLRQGQSYASWAGIRNSDGMQIYTSIEAGLT